MGLHGNSGSFTVATGSFTTSVTGATTLASGGFLINVSLVAAAQSTPPFSVVTYLSLKDPGANLLMRMGDLCGDVSGDPTYDVGTNGLDWTGHLELGKVRNELRFLINNNSGSTIVAVWGWVSSDD